MGEKKISNMLQIIKGDMIDAANWPNGQIDTIVNAAKPTLMGSNQGVDGVIHRAVDLYEHEVGWLKRKICSDLRTEEGDTLIRCQRGKAVTTEVDGFCKHIIHVVGAIYDGKLNGDGIYPEGGECTSSCIKTLESCYYEIVEEIKKHTDMETVGIPIIGSGEYKVPFETAAKIAVASVGNALIDWKNQDKEMFEMAGIKKIIFFVYDLDGVKRRKEYECIKKILEKFNPIFKKDRKVAYQSSWKASLRYLKDVCQNDHKRGYFAVAKTARWLILILRFLFLPLLCLKDLLGKYDWQKRRTIVESMAFIKIFVPFLGWFLVKEQLFPTWMIFGKEICIAIVLYLMLDTITYILVLILMADIQSPSANIIRSMILLFVNYVEVASDMAFLYYCYYRGEVRFRNALAFGFFGELSVGIEKMESLWEYVLWGGNIAVGFFFITLALGYFMGHMRQRKFRS